MRIGSTIIAYMHSTGTLLCHNTHSLKVLHLIEVQISCLLHPVQVSVLDMPIIRSIYSQRHESLVFCKTLQTIITRVPSPKIHHPSATRLHHSLFLIAAPEPPSQSSLPHRLQLAASASLLPCYFSPIHVWLVMFCLRIPTEPTP